MLFPLCSLGWDSNRGRDAAKDAFLRRAFRRHGPGSMAWERARDWMGKAGELGCAAEAEAAGERFVRVVAKGVNTPAQAPDQGPPAAARALDPAAQKKLPRRCGGASGR